jgi:hypothetical protein
MTIASPDLASAPPWAMKAAMTLPVNSGGLQSLMSPQTSEWASVSSVLLAGGQTETTATPLSRRNFIHNRILAANAGVGDAALACASAPE